MQGSSKKSFEEKIIEILGSRSTKRNLKTIHRIVLGLDEGKINSEQAILTAARVFVGIGKKLGSENRDK